MRSQDYYPSNCRIVVVDVIITCLLLLAAGEGSMLVLVDFVDKDVSIGALSAIAHNRRWSMNGRVKVVG